MLGGEEDGGCLSMFSCSKVFFTMSVILSQLQAPLLRNPYVLSTVIILLPEFCPQLHAASEEGTLGTLLETPGGNYNGLLLVFIWNVIDL